MGGGVSSHEEKMPSKITNNFATRLQAQVKATIPNTGIDTFFPKLMFSYATGWREGLDDEDTGPGLVYVAKLVMMFHEAGIASFSGLHVPAGKDWKAPYYTKLGGDDSECEVVIVLLTKALYNSRNCLEEVAAAIRAKVKHIIPVVMEEGLPKSKDQQWTMIEREDTDGEYDKMKAREALTKNTFPERGTLLDDPEAPKRLLEDVAKILKVKLKIVPRRFGPSTAAPTARTTAPAPKAKDPVRSTPAPTGNIDAIIESLLEVRGARPGKHVNLAESDIKWLCTQAREVFMEQPILLELGAPIKVCGNIMGQYFDLLRLFEYGGFPPEANYLFLGGYVNRGKQSLETICLLLAYKIKYPKNFFLLRGNWEIAAINRIYGFYDECKRRYNIKLWRTFNDCFNCLPVAAVIDEKIFCCHGGLSPDCTSMDQIRRIMRPTDVPDTGMLCDLLWSDPDIEIMGWGENDRGLSFTFGPDVVQAFLKKHDFDLVVRAHQLVEDGYEFFAKRTLVTLFSAPNYCGEFDNAGAIMSIDESLMCVFQILKPVKQR